MTPYRSDLALPFPAAQQRRNYPLVLKHDCPTCYAKAGEACMPAGISIPHLLRIRAAETPGSAA